MLMIRPLESNSIGGKLRSLRKRQGISLEQVARNTKVQKKYLEAIERDAFSELPDQQVALRVLATFATALNGDPAYFAARFQDEAGMCFATPTLLKLPRQRTRKIMLLRWRSFAFAGVLSALATAVLIYLGFQILALTAAPNLLVDSPGKDMETTSQFLEVTGQTEKEAQITVNNNVVVTDPTGRFTHKITLERGHNQVVITARRKFGKSRTEERNVFFEPVRRNN